MKYSIPISIIMTSYNAENYISESIKSMLAQTYCDFEFIIIDDGSTDNTYYEIKKFDDQRVRIIQNRKNVGQSVSRNYAANICRGKYICNMDADDISMPDRLIKQYTFMEKNSHVGLLGGCCEFIDSNGTSLGYKQCVLDYNTIKIALLKSNMFTHPTIFFRKSLIRRYGIAYNRDFPYTADYDFVVKCSEKFPIRNLDEVLIQYRRHHDQISSNKWNEQMTLADKVRERQLDGFNAAITDSEKRLYLRMMQGRPILEEEAGAIEEILNKLLEANATKKLYNQHSLLKFFRLVGEHALATESKI